MRALVKFALRSAEWPARIVSTSQNIDANKAPPRRILAWTMDRIGDVVRMTPALRALREAFPDVHLAAVAAGRAAPVLENNPRLDAVHVVARSHAIGDHVKAARAIRKERFDLGVLFEVDPSWALVGVWWMRYLGIERVVGFSFDGSGPAGAHAIPLRDGKSWAGQFLALAREAGAGVSDDSPEAFLSDAEREEAPRLIAGLGADPAKPFAVLHPGGNFLTVSRQWPPQRYAEIADALHERWGLGVIVTGIATEQASVDAVRSAVRTPIVDACGRLSMRQLMAVIERAALCVMNDTGPLHLAQALGRPAVAVLGPTAPEVVGIAPRTVVARKRLPCSPCAFLTGWRRCTNPRRWECLGSLDSHEVLSAVDRALADPCRRPAGT